MSRTAARIRPVASVCCVAIGTLACSFAAAGETVSGPAPLDLFEQRIMPIFKSPEPSSCVQCHLSAVDLKDYILPSQEQTFASLRDQGLIDLVEPENSKILKLIQMGEKDIDEGAKLIHAETRQAEYEAFAAWIKACAADSKLRALPTSAASEQAGPERPDEVIRHARKSRVVDSFVRNVWSQRMRCFPCHTPHEIDHANPKQEKAIARAEKLREQFGERMHIFRETPGATMDYLIEKSREASDDALPLINLENPAKSLLVLKPTSKLPKQIEKGVFEEPSYTEPVSHMGGLKMHPDDFSYKSFIAWIGDYARVVGDEYTSVAELPPDNWIPTEHAFFLQNAPDDWPVLTTVQIFIHSWDEENHAWTDEPVAFTQGKVNPRRIVFGVLFLLGNSMDDGAREGTSEKGTLSPGRYLLKAYVDTAGRLAEDPTAILGNEAFGGQMEIEAKWGVGFAEAERVSGDNLEH